MSVKLLVSSHMNSYSRLMKALAEKVALVTGASRGIGRGIAVGLARHGARVAISARTMTPRDGRMALVCSSDNISIELLQDGEALAITEPWESMENSGEW
jgi:NAD(P)-dependent dehydrogenase (short-subunit alcohol dehydrogenase family)